MVTLEICKARAEVSPVYLASSSTCFIMLASWPLTILYYITVIIISSKWSHVNPFPH